MGYRTKCPNNFFSIESRGLTWLAKRVDKKKKKKK